MEFDIMAVLVFLWFIFRGLRKSQQAKREHEARQKERPAPPPRPRPVMQQQPRKVEKEEPTASPFPPWFPFPIPIEIEETVTKQKPRPKQVVQEIKKQEPLPLKQEATQTPIKTVIEEGEAQWKTEGVRLNFNKENVTKGIIWAEVLGAPKGRRKGLKYN